MARVWRAALAACLLVLSGCATQPRGPEYTNPVLDADFADPAVLRAPDGAYYAYATQTTVAGRWLNVQVARSEDLVAWQHLGDALPGKPRWAAGKQNIWAPHVIYDAMQRRYFMYYSAEPDAARGKCLAVATAVDPAGPFTDSGRPLICGQGIEHIDPMAFDDPRTGKRLLYWGSGRLAIKGQEMAEDRMRFLPGSSPVELIHPDRAPYRSLVEAPWVIHRNGFYYLFYSGDRCCVGEPRYSVMVARAKEPLGPFENFRGRDGASVILERDGWWLNTGHAGVVTDGAGNDWLLYHATDASEWHFEDRPRGRMGVRRLMLDPLQYGDGWPRVEGARPSSGPRPAPIVAPTPPLPPSGRRESVRP
jgi:arabinan endo-1,5-alpha-L-arabinosidase